MEGDLRRGRADAICNGDWGRRGVVCRLVPALRGEPEDRLQMAVALRGRGRAWAGRSLARAGPSSARGVGRDRRALSGGASAASDMGSGEGAGMAGAARAADRLAWAQHDWSVVRPRRPDGEAPTPPPQPPLLRPLSQFLRPPYLLYLRL